MNMIKVCYVLSTSEKSGGANKSLLDLVKRLNRNEIEPYALLRRHGDIEDELKRLGVTYTIIPFINSVTTGNPIKDLLKRITYKTTFSKIKSFYSANNIDIVHNNSLPALAGMEVANIMGIPYICHFREDVEKGLGVGFLDKKRHMKIADMATKKIAISNFIKDSYSPFVSDISVIYDGMDVDQYYEEKDILTKKPYVMSIYGNLDEQKGQMIAVKAMEVLQQKGINDFVLNIVGNQNTEYGRKVKKYVDTKSIDNIRFIDNISSVNELRKQRLNDDINLVCSSAEGLGRVTIESMLAGCLTIGASAGATTEIISNDYTGLLFKDGDFIDLGNSIEKLRLNKEARNIAKQGQEKTVDLFNIEKYSSLIQEIYKGLLQGSSSIKIE